MSTKDSDAQPAAEATPRHNRRQRASPGGFKTRLDAPQKKGMVMRWVNDEPGRIEAMHKLGYDFAERDTRSDGQGTRISRNVGTHPNGAPKLAYLMETPDDQYAIGVQEKEERLGPFEKAINERRGHHGQGPGRLRAPGPQHHQQFIGLGPKRTNHGQSCHQAGLAPRWDGRRLALFRGVRGYTRSPPPTGPPPSSAIS
jgi:hypothetical protein